MCTKNILPQKTITSNAETTTRTTDCITYLFLPSHPYFVLQLACEVSEGRYLLFCVMLRDLTAG